MREPWLCFMAGDATYGNELWRYDAATDTAGRLSNINPTGNSNPRELTVYDGKLYFNAYDGSTGTWLHSFDGSSVELVADIVKGADGSRPKGFAVFGDWLVFSANDCTVIEQSNAEVWGYDGTRALCLADLNGEDMDGSEPAEFTEHDGRLYFRACGDPSRGDAHGTELWVLYPTVVD